MDVPFKADKDLARQTGISPGGQRIRQTDIARPKLPSVADFERCLSELYYVRAYKVKVTGRPSSTY